MGIHTNPITETPANFAIPTLKQIEAKPQEIQVLADEGHFAPALIYGWAILESLARLASGPARSKGLSPVQAVQALAEEGYIENEDAHRLREMAKLRSAVAHGDFTVNIAPEQVDFMVRQLIPDAPVADSSGDKGVWYRARGWWGGRAPKKTLMPAAVDPSFMGQHYRPLV